MEEVKEEKKEPLRFEKEQIVNSKRYVNRKDLLSSILEDGKSYSFKEVDKAIYKFMKGKVK